jgi:hypothetical protein
MTRMLAIVLAALIAAAPVAASAQERAPRGGREDAEQNERPRISQAEAQGIAQSRAGNARFVGYLGYRGGRYVYRFERDGRIIDISVDAQTGR